MAVKATLEVMLVPGFLDTALENGNQLQAKLQAALSDIKETVNTVRGLGYMIGIETTGQFRELVQSARDKGLIVLTVGDKRDSSFATNHPAMLEAAHEKRTKTRCA